MGKIFEGYWDCSYCGTNKIRGSIRNCPSCGKPRGNDVRFYIDSTSREVKNPDEINKNPDWLCSYCDSLNSDSVKVCHSCGHTREESDLNYFENQNKRNSYSQSNYYDTYTKSDDIYIKTKKTIEENKNKSEFTFSQFSKDTKSIFKSIFSGKNIFIFSIIAGVLLLGLLLTLLFIPKTKSITVESLPWERFVEIEVYKTVYENSWELPDDAYNVKEKQEIYTYNHTIDHYETKTRQKSREVFDGYDISYSYKNLGNGYFEQIEHRTPRYRTEYYTETYSDPVYVDIPVYKTKYYYNIEKWVYDHTETTSGNDGKAYYYEVNSKDGLTRSGFKSSGEYHVIDTDGNKYKIDYDLWINLNIGQKYLVKVSTFKRIIKIIE